MHRHIVNSTPEKMASRTGGGETVFWQLSFEYSRIFSSFSWTFQWHVLLLFQKPRPGSVSCGQLRKRWVCHVVTRWMCCKHLTSALPPQPRSWLSLGWSIIDAELRARLMYRPKPHPLSHHLDRSKTKLATFLEFTTYHVKYSCDTLVESDVCWCYLCQGRGFNLTYLALGIA